ncbi:MAG: O-antigen ligase family protein [Endozoicomonas sp.]
MPKDSVQPQPESRNNLQTAEAYDHLLPQVMFYLIIAFIPFFRWRTLPVLDLKIDWVLTALLLMILAPYLILQKQIPRRLSGNAWVPLLLFLLANFVAYLLSPFPEQAMSGLTGLLMGALFMIISALMVSDRGFEKIMPLALALSMGLAAGLAVLGYFGNLQLFINEENEALGASSGANNMALMCLFVLPLMVYWAVHGSSSSMRTAGIFLSALLVLGVISTVSRGGFLNLTVVLALLLFQYRKYFKIKSLGLIVAIAGMGLLAAAAVIPKEFFERQASIVTVGSGNQDQSLDRRASYVKVAIDATRERPVIGWGTDVFKKVWVRSEETRWFKMQERPAHNTYLEVIVGSGFIGLFLFLLMMWKTFSNFHSAERRLMSNGFQAQAHLCGAYKLGLLSVMFYFFFKSGLDHKYFLLIIPLSMAAVRFAENVLASNKVSPEKATPTTFPSSLSRNPALDTYIPRRHARRNSNT